MSPSTDVTCVPEPVTETSLLTPIVIVAASVPVPVDETTAASEIATLIDPSPPPPVIWMSPSTDVTCVPEVATHLL